MATVGAAGESQRPENSQCCHVGIMRFSWHRMRALRNSRFRVYHQQPMSIIKEKSIESTLFT